jgi:hypothetical protein
MLFVIIAVAILYFGWPIIEKILIALPIPDPKDVKEKFFKLFSRGNN